MCWVGQLACLYLEELHNLQSSGDIQGIMQLIFYNHPEKKETYSRKIKTCWFSVPLRLMLKLFLNRSKSNKSLVQLKDSANSRRWGTLFREDLASACLYNRNLVRLYLCSTSVFGTDSRFDKYCRSLLQVTQLCYERHI